MSDSEWSKILDGWTSLEPPAEFADGVMARLSAPDPLRLTLVAPPRESRRASLSTLLFAAVAVAALVIFPLAIHLRTPPRAAATVVAAGASSDLGLERD